MLQDLPGSSLPGRWNPLRKFLRGDGPRSGPLILDRSRIYVFPTRLGIWFGLLLLVMLLGAMNYSNNLGLLFVFFLASAAVVSILHTYQNLARVEFRPGRSAPVFAGTDAGFRLVTRNPRATPRRDVEFRSVRVGAETVVTDLPPGDGVVVVRCPVAHRGRVPLGRVTVSTRYPLGLFRAWAHLEFRDLECLVYPRPAPPGAWPPAAAAAGVEPGSGTGGEEDLAGLRPYAPGDPMRTVHWKATAKRDRLVVVERAGGGDAELWLAWELLPGVEVEQRLRRLCRWVLDAHSASLPWGLRLPGLELAPDRGPGHRQRCLGALAEFRA